MTAYYNENEPYAAEWLRNLIAAGHIAKGEVDERSIADVTGADLAGFDQCHFFAGLGGWSLALRLAGWPDDRPVWTGSCPCQPFSAAGRGRGAADERHLWPVWFDLIAQCRPDVVFGEQVESAVRHGWLDGVCADLESENYTVGAVVLGAHSVGAPHIRQRLWWVADAYEFRHVGGGACSAGRHESAHDCDLDRLADANQGQRGWLADSEGRKRDGEATGWQQSNGVAQPGGAGVGYAECARLERYARHGGRAPGWPVEVRPVTETGSDGLQHPARDGRQQRRAEPGQWGAEFRRGADGKSRRIEPSIQPLAHGVSNRVGRLRAYGNAIVPQVAAQFITAFCGAQP